MEGLRLLYSLCSEGAMCCIAWCTAYIVVLDIILYKLQLNILILCYVFIIYSLHTAYHL